YRFRNSSTFTNTLSDIEFTTGSRANQFQNQQQTGNNGNISHNLRGRLKWDIDSMYRIDIHPNLPYTKPDRANSPISSMSTDRTEPLNNPHRNRNNNNEALNFAGRTPHMDHVKKAGQTTPLGLDGNKITDE